MTEKQKQVIISGILGDGTTPMYSKNAYFSTCCKYLEYIKYKATILDTMLTSKWLSKGVSGYTGSVIHRLHTKASKDITALSILNLDDLLSLLNDFGIALWFYDDGSLHNSKFFYNLNTQDFSKSDNYKIADFLSNRLGIKCKVAKDKDYFYIRINKLTGASTINNLLRQYPIPCYSYKTTEPNNFTEIRNVARGVPVLVGGIKYECIKDAAKELGILSDGITRAFRLGRDSYNGYDISKV